jgi:hypothetical protein
MVEKEQQKANDVPLHDGEGFLVESQAYRQHCELRQHDQLPVILLPKFPSYQRIHNFVEIHLCKP